MRYRCIAIMVGALAFASTLAAQDTPNFQRNTQSLEQHYDIFKDSDPIPPEDDGSLEEEIVIGDGLRAQLRQPTPSADAQFSAGRRLPNFQRQGSAGVGQHLNLNGRFTVSNGEAVDGSTDARKARLMAIARAYLEEQGAEELGSASDAITFTVQDVFVFNGVDQVGGGSVSYSRDVSGIPCLDGRASVIIDATGNVVQLTGTVFDADAMARAVGRPTLTRDQAATTLAALAPKDTVFPPNDPALTCRAKPPFITWDATTSAHVYRVDAATGMEVQ